MTVDRNVEYPSPRTINPANKILEEEKQQRDSSATEKMERRQMHLPLYTHLMRSNSTVNSVAVRSIERIVFGIFFLIIPKFYFGYSF